MGKVDQNETETSFYSSFSTVVSANVAVFCIRAWVYPEATLPLCITSNKQVIQVVNGKNLCPLRTDSYAEEL